MSGGSYSPFQKSWPELQSLPQKERKIYDAIYPNYAVILNVLYSLS